MSWIRKSAWLITTIVIAIPVFVFGVVRWYERKYESLPVYGEEVKDAEGHRAEHRIADFSMTNQDWLKVTLGSEKGKIVVANFFFTSCPSICPKMMNHLRDLRQYFVEDSRLALVSFTVDPARDSSARLAEYAAKRGIDTRNWNLLTGDKREIYRLARKSFYLSATEGDGGEDDFIHSDQLVLLDTLRRIRGYYSGTDEKAIENIKTDIKKLENER